MPPESQDMDLSRINAYKREFMRVARQVCPQYEVREEQKETINDIFRWCMRLPGRYNPGKGLWICGNIGTGKSTMLAIVKEFCKMVRPIECGRFYSFRTVTESELCSMFANEGFRGIEDFADSHRLAIDDIGIVDYPINHYGTTLNVIQYMLQTRYDKRHNAFTHVTTNITREECCSLYGVRVYDRCKEMFNIVEFPPGKTFRKN